MPVLDYVNLKPDIEHVLIRAGAKDNPQAKTRIVSTVQELLLYVDKAGLLSPAICYEYYDVEEIEKNKVILDNDISLYIPMRIFKNYKIRSIVVVICTIGLSLEQETSKMFNQGQPFRGYLLDNIGNTAVDMLSQTACNIIEAEAISRNIKTSSPVGPGMFSIPVTEQPKLIALARADRIGISLSAACEMIPRKTVSMIIGMGNTMPLWSKAHVCKTCSLSKTCQYNINKITPSAKL
jgi:hypothetical protein